MNTKIKKRYLQLKSIARSKLVPKFLRKAKNSATFSENVPKYESLSKPYAFSSMLCREQHFHMPLYSYWCQELKEIPKLHRKQWEFVYICHVLFERGYMSGGLTAIGFGVGKEPLSSYFASKGLKVVATDLDFENAKTLGWVDTNQHSDNLLSLNERGLCSEEIFFKNTIFKNVDMNNIPEDIGSYDISWSSCAFEHLGSIRKGMDFVINACRLLNPGGIAVHTTEYNVSFNDLTMDNNPHCVIFRKKDIEQLTNELRAENFIVEEIDFTAGEDKLEQYVDLPPYLENGPHLRLELSRAFVTTSIGIIVRKPETVIS